MRLYAPCLFTPSVFFPSFLSVYVTTKLVYKRYNVGGHGLCGIRDLITKH